MLEKPVAKFMGLALVVVLISALLWDKLAKLVSDIFQVLSQL